MTLYLTKSLGYSIGQAGIVMAIFGMGSICGGIIGGKLTDKYGFYFIQLFALFGGGVMFLLLGQMKSYIGICIVTFILSLVNDSFRPANAAAIAHYSLPENRTRSYSLNRLSINIGWAVGGAMGGLIASRNYHMLFIIDGLTNIGAAFMLWRVLAPSKNKATPKEKVKSTAIGSSAYSDKYYLAFILLVTLFAYCFFQMFSTLTVYYRDHLHMNESSIGIVMAVNGILIALFEMVIVHRLEGRRHVLQYIMLGTLLMGVSFVMFNVLDGGMWLALTSMLVVTIAEIFAMPFMNTFWIMRSNDANRGQYAGLYTVAWSVAQVLGPATGAQIAEHAGFRILWWTVGGVSLLSVLGYAWLYKKMQQQAQLAARTE
jgi:predicted MFS family arabinose efflux permease